MRSFSHFLVFFLIFDSLSAQTPDYKLAFGNQFFGIDTPCTNMDFEECSFNSWELFMGDVPGGMPYSYSNDTSIPPGSQHIITSGGSNDPIVPVSKVFPGGACSMRLGDGTGTGAKGARLKQTFFVDSNNSFLTFRYAVILEDPQHPPNDQPYFRVKVYDSTGTSIPCGEYNVRSGPVNSGGDPDFIVIGGISYKDWTTEFINLDGYTGENITVEYIVGDCAQGGHYGYAYIDGACDNNTDGIRAVYQNSCGGFPVNLQTIYNGENFLWSTGDTTPSISVDSNGIYSITVTTKNGCSRSFIFNLQNTVAANADFSFVNSCSGNPVIFTDLSTVTGGSITGWQWDFDDSSGVSFQQNPQHTFDTTGVYNVTLTISTNSGCTHDTSLAVTLTDSFTLITGPDTICLNENEIIFTASDSGGTWAGAGITDSIDGAFDPSVAGAGTHLVSYFVSGECTDTGFHQIVVNEGPSLLVDSIHHITCFGENDGAFFTSASGGTTPYSYLWGTGCSSCIPDNLNAGTYIYFISDASGCLDSSEIIITQPDSIQISISTPSVILCEGESSVLAANVTGGIFPYLYQWTSGDTNQTIIGFASQFYKVTVMDANECSNSASVFLDFLPSPLVNLGNDTSIIENANLILNAANYGSSYLWSTGEITQNITVSSEGEYFVIVTDSNDCSNSDTIFVSVITFIPENFFIDGYRIYPNPATDKIMIEKKNSLKATVIFNNLLGVVFYQTEISDIKSEIDISSFSKGIYFLLISDENNARTEKIIID